MQRQCSKMSIIATLLASLTLSNATAQVVERQRITPTPRSTSQIFGMALDFDGTAVAIGAGFENSPQLAGAAYVYHRNTNGTWSQAARLRSPNTAIGDFFGTDVALDGDTLVVGSPGRDEAGATFVYRRDAGVWTLAQTLTPSNPIFGGSFGDSVAISGNTLAVLSWSVPFPDAGGFGALEVNIFENVGGSWVEQARLLAPETFSNGFSGANDIVIANGTIFVGGSRELHEGDAVGAVYVYQKFAGVWSQTATIRPSDLAANANFGQSLAVSGGRLVVGAPQETVDGFSRAGSLYLFEGSAATWTETGKHHAPTPAAREFYGVSVALDGDNLLVGAYQSDTSLPFTRAGYACLYQLSANDPGPAEIIRASDGEPHDLFGWRVALSGEEAVVSAIFQTTNRGAAYFYTGVPVACPEDLDGDRFIGLTDLALLLTNFGTSDPGATGDVDGDDDVDLTDLATLLVRFGVAC